MGWSLKFDLTDSLADQVAKVRALSCAPATVSFGADVTSLSGRFCFWPVRTVSPGFLPCFGTVQIHFVSIFPSRETGTI